MVLGAGSQEPIVMGFAIIDKAISIVFDSNTSVVFTSSACVLNLNYNRAEDDKWQFSIASVLTFATTLRAYFQQYSNQKSIRYLIYKHMMALSPFQSNQISSEPIHELLSSLLDAVVFNIVSNIHSTNTTVSHVSLEPVLSYRRILTFLKAERAIFFGS